MYICTTHTFKHLECIYIYRATRPVFPPLSLSLSLFVWQSSFFCLITYGTSLVIAIPKPPL